MKVIDVSWEISERMTVYKDKSAKKPRISQTRVLREHGMNESRLVLDSHTGTHVDAPRHFFAKGKGIDKVKPIVGSARVLSIRSGRITAVDLKGVRQGDIVLLRTRNSSLSETGRFRKDFVFLDKSGAVFLAKKKIKAVGIDYLGIERSQPEHETHKILLRKGIPIIEGLRLKNVKAGVYDFVCLPLRIKDCDAAPARAVLIKK